LIVRILASILLLVLAVLAQPRPAWSQAEPVYFEPSVDGTRWLLSTDFDPPLTARLEEVASRGIPLHFTVEFELLRPRWYWWPERVFRQSASRRLAFHPLTGDYRLSEDGAAAQSYMRLEDALVPIVQLRNWRIELPADLEPGPYLGQVRLRLDSGQLPKPVRIDALTNRDLYPQAEWKRFPVSIPTKKSAQ
jgi:hypothetical protein